MLLTAPLISATSKIRTKVRDLVLVMRLSDCSISHAIGREMYAAVKHEKGKEKRKRREKRKRDSEKLGDEVKRALRRIELNSIDSVN